MSNDFDMLSYYQSLREDFGSEILFVEGEWNVNFEKIHAFSVSKDVDRLDKKEEKISIEPITETNLTIDNFSSQNNLELFRTKIIDVGEAENVELDLNRRIITIVMDQSGSMTWNDNSGTRHNISQQMIEDINNRYPGVINYNIIKYEGLPVKIIFFGSVEDTDVSSVTVNSLSSFHFGDEEAGFAGTRVVRKLGSFPQHPLDGDLIVEGFMTKSFDTDLTKGSEYFYSIFTFDKNYVFSEGVNVSAIPRERIIPRGIVLTSNRVIKGSGVLKDENTIGIWHFDEAEENIVYDFSSNKKDLEFSEVPLWYNSDKVAAGESGVRFNGSNVRATFSDEDNDLTFEDKDKVSILAWIFPYDLSQISGIFSRYDSNNNINYSFYQRGSNLVFSNGLSRVVSTLNLNLNEWNHVAVTYDSSSREIKFYINKSSETFFLEEGGFFSDISDPQIAIGYTPSDNNPSVDFVFDNYYFGRITEVSLHNIVRDIDYIFAQISTITVLDEVTNEEVIIESGLTGDNGDRIIIIKYIIPNDSNFLEGNVKIIRKELEAPSWHGDENSTLLAFKTEVSSGTFYATDTDDFSLGETYYYRIYSQNRLGNFSYDGDSPVLAIDVPEIDDFVNVSDLSSSFFSPSNFVAQPGNKKVYLKWTNTTNNRNSRISIYHSFFNYPVISETGNSGSTLIFNNLSTETNFVHRNVNNDKRSFYSIVYRDKYGRISKVNGETEVNNISAIPSLDADETGIPLMTATSVRYDIVDNKSISISWDQPIGSAEDIEGFLDQKVFLYASITDEFGQPISEDAIVDMQIIANIKRKSEAIDVFADQQIVSQIQDEDLYDFFVEKDDSGIIKGKLSITDEPNLLRIIDEAKFEIKVKSVIPNSDGEGNIFEYLSESVNILLTNPWSIKLINRDNKLVEERCYFIKKDEQGEALSRVFSDVEKKPDRLVSAIKEYNGVYVGASNPFVTRAIISFKGVSLDNNLSIDVAVWDAEMELCTGASNPDFKYIGKEISKSLIVEPSLNSVSIQNEIIEILDEAGEVIERKTISFVDIPLLAPSSPQAVKLFARGGFGGFSSIQELYIVFQTVLNIDIVAKAPIGDGNSVEEQMATAYLVDPDKPKDTGLNTFLSDDTVVKWDIVKREGAGDRPFYSIDTISVDIATNGIYSLIRNGTARNVFFGPVQDVNSPFEQYEINATAFHNGINKTARQFVEINGEEAEQPFTFNNKFLMEFVATNSGKMGSQKQNDLWADGLDYLKMIISRDPNSSSTRWSGCFRDCASRFKEDLIELNSEQIIQLFSDHGSVEFIWGDVEEEFDPYLLKWRLKLNGELGKDYFISKTSAFITLKNESVSDSTEVFMKINAVIPPREKVERGLAFELRGVDEFLNPCECLNIKNEFMVNEDITITGRTTVFINDNPTIITGGGDEAVGVPPMIMAPHEPLHISLLEQKINGEDTGSRLGSLIINDTDIIDIKVLVSFRGEPVPDNTPIFVTVGNNDGFSRLIAERNTIFTTTDILTGDSIAEARIIPLEITDESFTEIIKIISNYDESGTVEREKFVSVVTKVLSEEDENEGENPVDEGEEANINTVTSSSLERYNIDTDEWSRARDMNEARGNIFLEFVNEKLYASRS